MVDEIDISGSGIDWATEKTQADLLKAMKKAFKLDEKQAQKLDKTLTEAGKNGGFIGKEAKKNFQEFNKGLKETSVGAFTAGAGLGKLKGPLADFRKDLEDTSLAFKGGAVAALGIGTILGKLTAQYMGSVDVMRNLNDVGVLYKETHMDVLRILGMTGMNLEEFGELTGKYTRVIAQNGLTGITNLISATDDLVGGFKRFGLTTAEAADFVVDYMDRQRAMGLFQTSTQNELNKAIRGNIERLTAYSKILNVSRKDMIADAKDAMNQSNVRRRAYGMEEDQRKSFMKAFDDTMITFSAFGEKGKGFADIFVDLAGRLNPATSPLLKGLRAGGGAELATALEDYARGLERGESMSYEQALAFEKLIAANKPLLDQIGQSQSEYADMANSLGDFGFTLEEANASLEKQKAAYNALTDKQKEEQGITTFESYLAATNKNVSGLTSFEDGLNKLTQGALAWFANIINDIVIKLGGQGGAEGGISSILDKVGIGLGNLGELLGDNFSLYDFLFDPDEGLVSGWWDGLVDKFWNNSALKTGVIDPITTAIRDLIAAIESFWPWGDEKKPTTIKTFNEQNPEAAKRNALIEAAQSADPDAWAARAALNADKYMTPSFQSNQHEGMSHGAPSGSSVLDSKAVGSEIGREVTKYLETRN